MADLIITTTGSGQTTCGPGRHLVDEVAAIVGGVDENNIRAQALDCINRTRTMLNKRDLGFTKTTAGAITLVSGTRTYALPSAFKRPGYARLLDANNRQDMDLVYQDDAWFSHQTPDQETPGKPYYYSLRNAFGDGLISLYPIPDSGAASTWTLSVEYFARIPEIADDGAGLAVPEEVCDVLVLGGQYYLVKERGVIQKLAVARADYGEALNALVVHDRRISDEQPRFRIGRRNTFPLDFYTRF